MVAIKAKNIGSLDMVFRSLQAFIAVFLLSLVASVGWLAAQENKCIILATTVSTQDSGLLDMLIPVFQEETGYVCCTIQSPVGC
jgi:tungstate transport system substrate-binding protein